MRQTMLRVFFLCPLGREEGRFFRPSSLARLHAETQTAFDSDL
jgi:hypothetical protein